MKIVYLDSPALPICRHIEYYLQQISAKDNHSIIYELKDLNYDIGLNFLGTAKITKEHLVHPWFNWHPGPLPEYRGRDLAYHALLNGEKQFGATLHYMDENYDTGDIIEVDKFIIENDFVASDLVDKSHMALANLFMKWVPKILAGENILRRKQDENNAHYYKKTKIKNEVEIDPDLKQVVRALYCPPYFPEIHIGGRVFHIKEKEN